jgi:hypothetical protein
MKAASPSPLAVLFAGALLLAETSAWGQALAVKAGTYGAGLELEYGLGAHFGARLQLDGASISHRLNKTSVEYHGHIRFQNALALADWHPFADSWRMSAGLVYNNNRIDLTGAASNGTFRINGTTYPAASVRSLSGTLDFRKVAPYLGTGWGISPRGAGFFGSIDLGVLWQPQNVSLIATCGASIQGTAACNQLQSDTAAEQANLQDRTTVFRWWPLLQVGIGWRF